MNIERVRLLVTLKTNDRTWGIGTIIKAPFPQDIQTEIRANAADPSLKTIEYIAPEIVPEKEKALTEAETDFIKKWFQTSKTVFKDYVRDNLDLFLAASPDIQAKAATKWGKMYAEKWDLEEWARRKSAEGEPVGTEKNITDENLDKDKGKSLKSESAKKVCSICGLKVANDTALQSHMKTHV